MTVYTAAPQLALLAPLSIPGIFQIREANRDIVALLIEKDGLGDGDLGADLENDPDALDPVVSARILSLYFSNRGVDMAAHAQDWHQARKLVNSGFSGLDVFLKCVQRAQEKIS